MLHIGARGLLILCLPNSKLEKRPSTVYEMTYPLFLKDALYLLEEMCYSGRAGFETCSSNMTLRIVFILPHAVFGGEGAYGVMSFIMPDMRAGFLSNTFSPGGCSQSTSLMRL